MRAIELFAGGGGAALALQKFGFDTEHYELDESAVQTLQRNDVGSVRRADVTSVCWSSRLSTELVWASPPCQRFSKARHPNRRTLDLWPATLRAIRGIEPDRVIIENVIGAPWDTWQLSIESLGYVVTRHTLNAMDFGVPQFRRRPFLVCGRRPISRIPSLFAAQTAGTLSDCIEGAGDRRVIAPGLGFSCSEPWRLLRPAPTVTTTDAKGTRACSSSGYMFRMGPDRLSDALFLALGWCRASIRECANAQGFPRSYAFAGTGESQYRQIGNAVPPQLALAVIQSAMS